MSMYASEEVLMNVWQTYVNGIVLNLKQMLNVNSLTHELEKFWSVQLIQYKYEWYEA